MTLKTLFTIILKMIGIFFIKDIVTILMQSFASLWFFVSASSYSDNFSNSFVLILNFILLIQYGLLSYLLIFKAETIIRILKLDEGFDDKTVSFSIHRSTILSISIIVIGGYIVATELPNIVIQLINFFNIRKTLVSGDINPNKQYVILAIAKVLIGIMLIIYQRRIVNLIEFKRKK